MAKEDNRLEKLLDSIPMEELQKVSPECLNDFEDKISKALAARQDDEQRAKPPGEKSPDEFRRWMREEIGKSDDDSYNYR